MTFLDEMWHYLTLITFRDVLDILIVAVLIYQLIKFMRGTGAERLLNGIIVLLAATWISDASKLHVLYFILSNVMTVGLVALIIIFQPELRKILERFGGRRIRLFRNKVTDRKTLEMAIMQTVEAVGSLSWEKTGALIIFERSDNLISIANTGTIIDSSVSSQILKNVFYPKAPLHDGAVIISAGRLQAAGCILPLSNSLNLSKDLGTRHRAGIGMSETYDSLSVIVSEETGSISFAAGGMLKRHLAPETLERLLINELLPEQEVVRKNPLEWIRGKLK